MKVILHSFFVVPIVVKLGAAVAVAPEVRIAVMRAGPLMAPNAVIVMVDDIEDWVFIQKK